MFVQQNHRESGFQIEDMPSDDPPSTERPITLEDDPYPDDWFSAIGGWRAFVLK